MREKEPTIDSLKAQANHHRDQAKGAGRRARRACMAIVEGLLAEYLEKGRANQSAMTDGAVQALGRLRDELARAPLDVE